MVKDFLYIDNRVAESCIYALLTEMCVTPKPGLVDLFNNGAHNDMDFVTFLRSIASISPYFSDFAKVGFNLDGIDETTLNVIRPLGIECEKAMFRATHGVNTHKGAIFSLGILATAAGYCYKNFGGFYTERICDIAGNMAGASVKDFLATTNTDTITAGQRLYIEYGIRGIRGEAASGFSSVRKHALPVMRKVFSHGGFRDNDVYLHALLHLMAEVEDTNVISRGGLEALNYVKESAKNVLSMGGALTPEGMKEIYRMDEEFIRRNISPGGSADLLSVAIMLHKLETSDATAINEGDRIWTTNC